MTSTATTMTMTTATATNHDNDSDYINIHTWYTHSKNIYTQFDVREPGTNHSVVASRQSVVLRRTLTRTDRRNRIFRSFISLSCVFNRSGKIKSILFLQMRMTNNDQWKRNTKNKWKRYADSRACDGSILNDKK